MNDSAVIEKNPPSSIVPAAFCLLALVLSACGPNSPGRAVDTGLAAPTGPIAVNNAAGGVEFTETKQSPAADIKFCDLDWNRSAVSKYGNGKGWHLNGDGSILIGGQEPVGSGGILFLAQEHRDVHVSFELKADKPTDGGVFVRSDLKGNGYQIRVDCWASGGNVGGIYPDGNGLPWTGNGGLSSNTKANAQNWSSAWKENEWNKLEVKVEGQKAHIEVSINGTKVVDWTDSGEHNKGNYVGLQVHSGTDQSHWATGKIQQFRNFKILGNTTGVLPSPPPGVGG